MIERKLVIQNRYGLHARPAAMFVEAASHFVSDIHLIKDNLVVNGKSIMGVLMLAAEKGTVITLKAEGKDEEEAAETLAGLLEGKLDET